MEFSELQASGDLEWLLQCPPLMQGEESFEFGEIGSTLIDWDPVKRFRETKAAHRVGYYVEALIESRLASQTSVSDLRHGIQIRREKETLGELDFLFRKDDRLHHLEVALKLYLCFPGGPVNGSYFVGPNATDSFERKRDRLLGKQLPFGKEHIPEIDLSRYSVKGMIFYHPSDVGAVPLPSLLNPGHARGVWIRESEMDGFFSGLSSGQSGRILRKPFWLGAHGENLDFEGIRKAAADHFQKWDGPVFLALFEERREVSRVFVMPDCWPERR